LPSLADDGIVLVALDQRDARQHADTIKSLTTLDKRVTALEASRPKRRR
jgi:hypothetical protein